MANKLLSQKWSCIDGHILSAQSGKKKFDFTEQIGEVQQAIAFNVGHELAAHIVQLHNEHLMRKDADYGYREA